MEWNGRNGRKGRKARKEGRYVLVASRLLLCCVLNSVDIYCFEHDRRRKERRDERKEKMERRKASEGGRTLPLYLIISIALNTKEGGEGRKEETEGGRKEGRDGM
jgi:hypothetical protein